MQNCLQHHAQLQEDLRRIHGQPRHRRHSSNRPGRHHNCFCVYELRCVYCSTNDERRWGLRCRFRLLAPPINTVAHRNELIAASSNDFPSSSAGRPPLYPPDPLLGHGRAGHSSPPLATARRWPSSGAGWASNVRHPSRLRLLRTGGLGRQRRRPARRHEHGAEEPPAGAAKVGAGELGQCRLSEPPAWRRGGGHRGTNQLQHMRLGNSMAGRGSLATSRQPEQWNLGQMSLDTGTTPPAGAA